MRRRQRSGNSPPPTYIFRLELSLEITRILVPVSFRASFVRKTNRAGPYYRSIGRIPSTMNDGVDDTAARSAQGSLEMTRP